MPVTNGNSTVLLGRDLQIVLQGPNGTVTLQNVMSFQSAQKTATVAVDRLDGVQISGELPKGWTGSFELEKADESLDQFFAANESAWYNGGNVAVCTLYTYITEKDGSVVTWQYSSASVKFDDAGAWKGDSTVRQKVSFMADRRQQV